MRAAGLDRQAVLVGATRFPSFGDDRKLPLTPGRSTIDDVIIAVRNIPLHRRPIRRRQTPGDRAHREFSRPERSRLARFHPAAG
jgi:hypothetical protein